MMKPATIDFSQFGSALGQKLRDSKKLPWARSDWQGAPQGFAQWAGRPLMQYGTQGLPSANLSYMTEGGWRRRDNPANQGGMPFNSMPDLWTMLQNRFQR